MELNLGLFKKYTENNDINFTDPENAGDRKKLDKAGNKNGPNECLGNTDMGESLLSVLRKKYDQFISAISSNDENRKKVAAQEYVEAVENHRKDIANRSKNKFCENSQGGLREKMTVEEVLAYIKYDNKRIRPAMRQRIIAHRVEEIRNNIHTITPTGGSQEDVSVLLKKLKMNELTPRAFLSALENPAFILHHEQLGLLRFAEDSQNKPSLLKHLNYEWQEYQNIMKAYNALRSPAESSPIVPSTSLNFYQAFDKALPAVKNALPPRAQQEGRKEGKTSRNSIDLKWCTN